MPANEERGWAEIEDLLARISAKGERNVSFADAERMAALYRHAVAQLAESRARGYDRRRQTYLESLVQRAHFVVYPPPRGSWPGGLRGAVALVSSGFPQAFREASPLVALSLAVFAVAAALGYLGTLDEVDLAYPLVGLMYPPDAVQPLIDSPEARLAFLSAGRESGAAFRSAFAAGLVANNTRVAYFAFSVGIAGGLPSLLIQATNGALLGSLAALFDRGGFDLGFWAWALPHAVPEVLALSIAAAGGLRLGLALIDPKGRPRRETLARAGRRSALLLGLATLLLGYAALVEAYVRQLAVGPAPRLALAAANAILLAAYLTLAGRARTRDPAAGPGAGTRAFG